MGLLFSARIGVRQLEGLCRRLSLSLEAGVDVRTIFAREAQHATGPLRRRLLEISDEINHGQSLSDALAATADFFPPIFREMVAVGEQTGHLDVVLDQMADHYQALLTARRTFWGAIVWPLFQLGVAVVVVGFLVALPSLLHIDVLHAGLTFRAYVALVAAGVIAIWFLGRAMARGTLWVAPLQRFLLQLPGLGPPLQTMALARLAWSMHLTFDTGMEVRRALNLSLRSTQNARYTSQIPAIDAEIAAGSSIYEAFRQVGGYPDEFLDTLATGEQSGKVVESMGLLARQYQERARLAIATLATLAGWVVWLIIAAAIIFLIFRIFGNYLNTLNNALQGR
jgi:type IV pilus assembly protein PilC